MPNIPLHRSFIHVSWHNHLKISKNEGDYEGLNDFFKRKTTYNIGVYVRMRRSGDDVYRFVWWHIQSRGLVLSKWRTIFFYSPIRKNNSRTFGKVVACSPMPSQCSRGKRQEGQKSSHRHRGKSAARGTSRQGVPEPASHSCPPVSPALQLSFPPAPHVSAHRLSSSMADHGRAVCMPYAETCVKSMPYFSVFHFLS